MRKVETEKNLLAFQLGDLGFHQRHHLAQHIGVKRQARAGGFKELRQRGRATQRQRLAVAAYRKALALGGTAPRRPDP